MGLFDTVRFMRATGPNIVPHCAAGHPQLELQTKDFPDCYQHDYRVYDGGLYKLAERQPNAEESAAVVDNLLVLMVSHEAHYKRQDFTGTVDGYGYCNECQPVLFEKAPNSWNQDVLDDIGVWCEYDLRFKAGELVEITPTRCDTRDDVARLHPTRTRVPDDDRIAKRHLELMAANRRRR